MRWPLRRGVAAIAFAFPIAGGACAIDALSLLNRSCPCVAGYECDPASNVCVPAEGPDNAADAASDEGVVDAPTEPVADAYSGTATAADADTGTDTYADAPQEATCSYDVMSDPDNCGVCGHYCLGGGCEAGSCTPITLAPAAGTIGLAIDATYVYWADNNDAGGSINRIPKALTQGGMPSVIIGGPAYEHVQDVATDGTYVYWTYHVDGGSVQRALPTGASLSTIAANQGGPDWIVSNGTAVFWTNEITNQVMSAPVAAPDGGLPTAVQLNVTNELGSTPAGLAIDATNAYYASKTAGGGIAERVPIVGGAATELGSGTFVGIAVDDVNVYWTGGFSSPSVYQNSKIGSPSTQITIASGGSLTCPLGIAADGVNVYFLDQGTDSSGNPLVAAGALYRVPVGGVAGPLPPPLVSGLTNPQGLAVDATAVYWVNGTATGSVMKLAK